MCWKRKQQRSNLDLPLIRALITERVPLCHRSAHKLVHILFAKCPVFWGLLQMDYVKLFMNDPLPLASKIHSWNFPSGNKTLN